MKSLRTITVTILWLGFLATGQVCAQARFDRAVAVGTGKTAVRGVAVAPDGSVIVCGTFEDSTRIGATVIRNQAGNSGAFLARFSSALESHWAISLQGIREARGVAVDSSGNIFVAGWGFLMVRDSADTLFGNGYHDIFLLKFEPGGKLDWARNIGSDTLDNGLSVACVRGGGAVVVGSFNKRLLGEDSGIVTSGKRDILIASFDSLGNQRWVRRAGGPDEDYCTAVAVDMYGNVLIGGRIDGAATFGDTIVTPAISTSGYIACYDSAGKFQWVFAPGGQQAGETHGLAIMPDGTILAAGEFWWTMHDGTDSLPSFGQSDASLIHLDEKGGRISWRHDGCSLLDAARGVAVSPDGQVFTSGWTDAHRDSARFGPFAVKTQASAAFLAGYDESLYPIGLAAAMGMWNNGAYGVAAGTHGRVYIVGQFERSARFGSIFIEGDTSDPATSTGFIARAHLEAESGVPVVPVREGLVVRQIVGTRGTFVIDGLTDSDADMRVFDILGRELGGVRIKREAGRATIDLGAVPAGAYIVSVYGAGPVRSALVMVR